MTVPAFKDVPISVKTLIFGDDRIVNRVCDVRMGDIIVYGAHYIGRLL